MPTVQAEYAAATAYVRGVVVAVEKQPIGYVVNPATGAAHWFVGAKRAAPFRFELALLEARWQHASCITDREQIVRAAQALALVAMQVLPPAGCIRDAGLVDVQTPGSTKAEIETVAALVHQLDADINVSMVDATFKSGWRSFAEEWQRFYGDHSGWWDRFWYSAYEKTVEFRTRLLSWRQKFAALGGAPTAPIDIPPEPMSAKVDRYGKWLLIGGGLFVGWKAFAYLRARRRENQTAEVNNVGSALNTALVRAADRRDARARTARRPGPLRLHLDDTELDSWFERDRGYIGLRDRHTGQMIVEWWDEDLIEAIEDGFLPSFSRWSQDAAHEAAFDYAKHIGLIEEPRDADDVSP